MHTYQKNDQSPFDEEKAILFLQTVLKANGMALDLPQPRQQLDKRSLSPGQENITRKLLRQDPP